VFRPFATALSAVVLAGALAGAADAETTSLAPTTPAVDAASTSTAPQGDQTAATQPAQNAFTISARVRAELTSLEAEADSPSPDADLQMWGAAPAASHGRATPSRQDAIRRFASGIISRTSSLATSLTRVAMRFIGTPYVFGGTSPSGFDCSGYTQHVFAMLGISLPRTADAQYYAGHPTRGGIEVGDLVFFQTYLPGPSHVGIYIGGGRFISSSGHGVRISALSDSYWAARYIGAKRVVASR
jgi:cell wall-associated NlpC family hydrolase